MKISFVFLFLSIALASPFLNAMDNVQSIAEEIEDVAESFVEQLLYDPVPLNKAIKHGDWVRAQALIDSGVNVNAQGYHGHTALHLVTHRESDSYDDITESLLEHGADPNIQNKWKETALHRAAHHKREHAVKLLLEYGADPNITNEDSKTPLHIAAHKGSKEIMKLLLEHGANPYATTYGNKTSFDELSDDDFTKTWFIKTCLLSGGEEAIHDIPDYRKYLTSEPFRIIFRISESTLLQEMLYGTWNALNDYIEKGHANDRDEFGGTILIYAAALGKEDIVRYLLACGVDSLITTGDSKTIRDILKRILRNPRLTEKERDCYKRILYLFSPSLAFQEVQEMLRNRQDHGLLSSEFVTFPREITTMIADYATAQPVRAPVNLINNHPALAPQRQGGSFLGNATLLMFNALWLVNPLRYMHRLTYGDKI